MKIILFTLLFSILCNSQQTVFTKSENSTNVVSNKVSKEEYLFKTDSLAKRVDSILLHLKDKQYYFEKTNAKPFTSYSKINSTKTIFQTKLLKDIFPLFNSNYMFITIESELKNTLFDFYYKGDINNRTDLIEIEKEICKKLELQKTIIKENHPIIDIKTSSETFLVPSTKNEYSQVYDPQEKTLKITSKIHQFFNALNGYFPNSFNFERNFEDDKFYDFEINVKNFEALIKELKLYKYSIIENKRIVNHVYYKSIKKL
ncbi:Hypothetical protein KQS_12005 [Flavobacterium indicum GPTSA100-9 = DSM 17447]|uniref:Uncharacterized protein n=1 Tax=Flavobacterium indicum (strain DSM 17447 / CIP 109464 / GPTSA100-9) TaxID=1094466 RepID=H8XR78_FLAIG|nr:hypothetical protein [Flavobacterium indicum]CCG54312.1 Hypothetical protein KQS_12005 [Flavobacterium indicum GPTSA100-9 = DSM 17447]